MSQAAPWDRLEPAERLAVSHTNISPMQQMAASCTGAMATSLLVTPFDVIKTRLQAQEHAAAASLGTLGTTSSSKCMAARASNGIISSSSVSGSHCGHCGEVLVMRDGLMDHLRVERCPAIVSPNEHPPLRGTVDTFSHIWRNEGPTALWRGLTPTLVMAVPATVAYFTT